MQTFNFFRHIKRYHFNDLINHGDSDNTTFETPPVEVNQVQGNFLTSPSHSNACSSNYACGLVDVKAEGINLITSLRANSSIPYSVLPHVIDSVNQISNCLILACQAEALHCFTECVDGSSNTGVLHKFQTALVKGTDDLKESLGFF